MTEQQRLFKARIALALLRELGRRPTDEELRRFLRVLLQAASGWTVTTSQGGKPWL